MKQRYAFTVKVDTGEVLGSWSAQSDTIPVSNDPQYRVVEVDAETFASSKGRRPAKALFRWSEDKGIQALADTRISLEFTPASVDVLVGDRVSVEVRSSDTRTQTTVLHFSGKPVRVSFENGLATLRINTSHAYATLVAESEEYLVPVPLSIRVSADAVIGD